MAGPNENSLAPLAPLSRTEQEGEEERDDGASEEGGFLSAAASGSDDCHREEERRGLWNQGGDQADVGAGGRSGSGGNTTGGERFDDSIGAGKATADVKVCVHADLANNRRHTKGNLQSEVIDQCTLTQFGCVIG